MWVFLFFSRGRDDQTSVIGDTYDETMGAGIVSYCTVLLCHKEN